MSYYIVWKLRFKQPRQDPEAREIRYHTALFIETGSDNSGTLYHVAGSLDVGMRYEVKEFRDPAQSRAFHSKEIIGHTSYTNYTRWDSFLRGVPPPGRQMAVNPYTGEWEQVKRWNPLTFYRPGEPRPPLVRCTDWVEQRAIPALEAAGLLVAGAIGSGSSYGAPYWTQQSSTAATGYQTTGYQAPGSSSWPSATQSRWIYDARTGRFKRWSQSQWKWIYKRWSRSQGQWVYG
ncbi:hypothetical protein GGR51DRAFT_559358 [Nemania sp. FL0031]|nr:hypothetical protein GGR51DRAFT_559358 [Nemania sp. FL0031]